MKNKNLYFSTESAFESVIRQGWMRSPQSFFRIFYPADSSEMVLSSNGDVDGHPTWKWDRV